MVFFVASFRCPPCIPPAYFGVHFLLLSYTYLSLPINFFFSYPNTYDTPSEPDIDLILRPQICNANTELIKISRLQSHFASR